MAHVEKRGNKWVIRYKPGGRDGKTVTDPQRFADEASAKAELPKFNLKLIVQGPVIPGSVLSTEEAGARYEQNRLSEDKATVGEARRTWDRVCGERKWASIADITPGAVKQWRETKAPTGAMKIVSAVLSYVRDFEGQSVDPLVQILLRPRDKKRKPKRPLLTHAEMTDIQARADALDPGIGAMVYCLSRYGWRPISAGRVKVGHVSLDTTPPTIDTRVKSGDDIRHPINLETVRRLRPLVEGRDPEAFLWQNPIRALRPGDKGTMVRPFEERGTHSVAQFLGDKVTPYSYDIKRYAISRMAQAGVSLATIALFTGHRDLDVLMVYLRTNLTDATAALDRLESEITGNNSTSAATALLRLENQEGGERVGNGAARPVQSDPDDSDISGKIIRFHRAQLA